jgi:hypothetical protein
MVQRKVTTIEERGETFDAERPLTAAESDQVRVEEETAEDVLQRLLDMQGASEATWSIWRTLPLDNAGFVDKIPTVQLTPEHIQKRYGPGTYRIRGIASNGRYIKTVVITIAAREQAGTMIVPGLPGGRFDDYLAFIDRSKLNSKEDLKFWLTLLVPIAIPFVTKAAEALFRPAAAREPLSDLVQAVAAMKAITDGKKEEDPLKQLERVKALTAAIRDIAPDERPATGSTWVDLLRDALKELGPALAQMALIPQQQPGISARAPVVHPPVNGGAVAASPAQSLPPGGSDVPDLMQLLASQLPQLVGRAANDSDPELYANLIIDNIPPEIDLSPLVAFLERPDWFGELQRIEPHIGPYRGWFDSLRAALLELCKGEAASEGEAANEPVEVPAGVQPH